MRRLTSFVLALVATLALSPITPAHAQSVPVVFFQNVDAVSASSSSTTLDETCILIKYRGTTVGKPDVTVAAGGDLTLRIATVADITTGTAVNGIFDLSTPAAADDTWGEVVNRINTQGTNWTAVLVGCLASDLTDNTAFTLAATDAAGPKGVAVIREATSASATSVFSVQAALTPPGADTDIRYWLSGSPIGNTTGSTKPIGNPYANYQTFVQNIREKITSTGTVALFEVLGVTRTYDGTGKVSEVVRPIWSETGAATTVEKAKDFNTGPIVGARGEMIVVRQRTATDLTAVNLTGSGYLVRR